MNVSTNYRKKLPISFHYNRKRALFYGSFLSYRKSGKESSFSQKEVIEIKEIKIIKGHICYSTSKAALHVAENSYLIGEGGKVKGVYPVLPEEFSGLPVQDYGDRLIIPGLVDLHMHAPQYSFRSLGMDRELLDWLEANVFPEEEKYKELSYAKEAYTYFTEDLKRSATTRACVFGTVHTKATILLMELLEKAGIGAMVGKVNMDRNSPEYLQEESAEASVRATLEWLEEIEGRFQLVKPILTPRFIPACSDQLMERLGEIQKQYKLPVQSHLSENKGEIDWVCELCPDTRFYGEAYARFGMFGGGCKTVMAHCVWSSEEELELMRKNQVFIAHCPQSNTNLSSGIAPARSFLEFGIPTGLGSDVAGGHTTSIFRAMADAIQVSKLRWRLVDDNLKPLTLEEAFYMGTMGGGAFFGKAGSFLEGYELDAVVLDDENLFHPQRLTVKERLERMIYLSDDRNVYDKYVSGVRIIK